MACPPLPTITKNLALASDWEAARAHFTCVIKAETGGVWTTAQHEDRETRTRNWIYAQLAKYAKTTTAGAVVVSQTLKASSAYTPPVVPKPQVIQAAPTPIIAPSAPAPANVVPERLTMTNRTGIGSLVGAGVGSVIPGVGTGVGGVLGGVIGGLVGGKSKCPGPYNYNPITGGCDPKPGYVGGTQGLGLGLTSGGPCPTGFEWDGRNCIQTGFRGAVERLLPGGETGTGVDVYGQAVMGAFGKPALQPYVASQPVQRCPPGLVLGKDNLCYARSSIRNTDRKWPKPPRPALSAQDMKTIRKASSLQNKVKRAAQKSGFTCKKR